MEIRPTFNMRFTGRAVELKERIQLALDAEDASCKGNVRDSYLELLPNSETTHFWSPLLRAQIVEEGSTSIIRGRFAPKSETWTMFVAIYATIVFTTGIGAVVGFSQWSLDSHPWALWSIPFGAILIACVWLAARFGQKLGSDEMRTLSTFVESALRVSN